MAAIKNLNMDYELFLVQEQEEFINFINWTSGNDDIDKLIQECQIKAYVPYKIIEWVPYDNLKHIKYLTRGGFSEIYTASWIDGGYEEWDPKEQRLLRFGYMHVVLKSWKCKSKLAKSHLTISNKLEDIVSCYGLTKDPSNGNYMLVIRKMNFDLRKYLQRNHKKPTWKERIRIIYEISNSLYFIHGENAIHKDLHSGNILYSQIDGTWVIGDLGFCGPADKSSKSIYGNLPYIAPEVIAGKGYTRDAKSSVITGYNRFLPVRFRFGFSPRPTVLSVGFAVGSVLVENRGFKTETEPNRPLASLGYTDKSDIYSVAMLMWEISSGQPPFINCEHNYELAYNIIDGIRPKIISETPLEYKV
ncbi:hypothetical protein RclHR1_00020046 [Rhizophagus clarus]|uniref:Protein kinase domain-containing protein n=1 Tax=Rhizophagus clarus TaxID=94130 RepID=A0A2Z6QPM7_9GLOM|nr:hypothetical protein RclHR1_00020046 [Rhizophagus clarus]